MEETANKQPQTLDEQLETDITYRVHATFGTNLLKMHPTLLTVDSFAGFCFIDDKIIPKESQTCIEPIDDIMIRSSANH